MRKHKLGDDAFAYYVSLGDERGYQAVADHFKVSKRTVVTTAKRDNWAERLQKIERDARANSDLKLQETVEARNLRHAKMLRAAAMRAAKALQDFPLTSGMEGIKAAEMVIKLERLMAGEPGDRTELDIKEVTKREIQTLLTTRPVGADGPDDY